LAGDDVFSLRNVDYSEKGMVQEIIVEGRRKRQTVIYSALDYLGEKWYYTEEGHRYILDARSRRGRQWFVKGYLDKIPVIVRQPIIVGQDSDQPQNLFYYGAVAIEEHGFKRELLAVVMRKSNVNVVWDFYWVEKNKVPRKVAVLYRTKGAARYLRGR
jgi:hypothetical protein